MELLKKEIKFRATRYGLKELDLWLGRFVERELETLNEAELEKLRDILLEPSADLLVYFTGEKPLPTHLDAAFFGRVKGKRR